jgi:hypothetical protein
MNSVQILKASYCQISFNVKTHISGVHAYTPASDATSFNDGGQGGLIVVLGPINSNGLTTRFVNHAGASLSLRLSLRRVSTI